MTTAWPSAGPEMASTGITTPPAAQHFPVARTNSRPARCSVFPRRPPPFGRYVGSAR